ncbi:transposase [Bacillus sp. DNRA2]|uniref:transposase n=1 Tax=Bacillus sp. DNRA2 TaxID=2723053 RepID=UPI00145FCBC0|nr:transposase [Bacillus sp. DNRA2]NMD72710.1 transposase [Bacillus sp. DNRA2]
MPREARSKSKSGVYHLIWRGANRQEIFHEDVDWIVFLDLLLKYKQKCQLIVYAWCLMSNHVHLLMKEGTESISDSMKRVGVCYAQYYNWKYRTTGHLFQDRFKSESVEDRNYLITVIRYIHQNPVKAWMVASCEDWRWSSCRGYYGKAVYPKQLLDSAPVLRLFSPDIEIARGKFKEFNERKNHDKCLENEAPQKRLTDEEARREIKKVLGAIEIPQVKSLPKQQRKELLRKIKKIEGLSLRQAARILGISVSLVFKA